MSEHNRFVKLAERTGEVFKEFWHGVQKHEKVILTATGYAVYAGLLIYQPGADAHPLLHAAHDAAEFANQVSDAVEHAGGTETVKTLAECAFNGCLTPLFTTDKGMRLLASSPQAMMGELKEVLANGCESVQALIQRGMAQLRPANKLQVHAPAPAKVYGSLDLSKPLYDSDGYEHAFITGNANQVVTKLKGSYGLWDVKTGACLVEGSSGLSLSNIPPDPAILAERREVAANMLAELHAQAAIDKARHHEQGEREADSPSAGM